jgi:hypothetical protein
MLRAVGAWIYDRDPYVPIQVGAAADMRACVCVCVCVCVLCVCVLADACLCAGMRMC